MKRWLFLIVFVLLLACAIAWRITTKIATNKNLAQQTQTRKAAASNVVAAIAGPGEIKQTLSVVGSVTTPFDIKLASKVAGVVDYLQVRPGDRVTANEILARINPIEQQAMVAQERSVLAEDQQKYTQALITQIPTNTQVSTTIGQNKAQLAQAEANESQVTVNYGAQVAAAQAAVTDAQAKVSSAQSQQGAAQQGVNSAQANYNDATAKYTREYSLYKQGFVAAQDADDAYAAEKVQEAAVNSAKQTLNSTASAVNSALAELDSAKQQLSIVKKQGKANIVAAQAATRTAKEALTYSTANRAQIPAYAANLRALQAVVEADRAQLTNLQQQVQDTILKTPFAGTVTNRFIDPGSMATAGTQVLEIQFLDWLYVSCTAPVEYVDLLKVGTSATITFDGLPGRQFSAPIVLVTPSADPTSRQFNFQIKLDNSQGLFKPGMFGHVQVVYGKTHAAVIVPHEAVANGDAGPTVSVIGKDGVVRVTTVTLGQSDEKSVEITSGVHAGDQVVVLSYRPVNNGQKVTISQVQGESAQGRLGGLSPGSAPGDPPTSAGHMRRGR